MLEAQLSLKPDGFSAQAAYRSERHWVVCRTCRKRHEFYPQSDTHYKQMFDDFECRHPQSRGCYVVLMTPDDIERAAKRTEKKRRRLHISALNYAHNASVLIAFQGSPTTLDLTSFNSLASSATAGWSSQAIDNSSNLYLDYLAAVKIAAVNTAPASDKAFYIFAATAINTTDLPTTGASSGNIVPSSTSTAAALTFPSVSTLACLLPMIQMMPYPVQNITNQSPLFSVARGFGGLIGQYVWLPVINFSGMTIAASSNVFKTMGVYNTVA